MIQFDRFYLIVAVVLLLSGLPFCAFSHGDLEERIAELDEAIEAHPDSAELYMKRGSLQYQHQSHLNALVDFHQAIERGYEEPELYFQLAKTHLALKNYYQCELYLEQILEESPNHVQYLRLMADSYMEQACYDDAALLYEKVIRFSNKRIIENYLEASNAWASCATKYCRNQSIVMLENGIRDLGPLLVLYKTMVKRFVEFGDYELALKGQSRVIELMDRKEFALVERASIYIADNQGDKALADLNKAKAEIRTLPNRLQSRPAIKDLLATIESKIEAL